MKKRIEWIDVVRAVGMFLIIMGHTLETFTFSTVGKVIFAVHVPVFFVLSGYLFKEKPWKVAIKGNFLNLFLPYFATVIIMFVISWFHQIIPSWVNEVDLSSFIKAALYGSGTQVPSVFDPSQQINAIGAIWFLLAMFVGNLCYNLLVKLTRGNDYILVVAVILCTYFGFYLTRHGIYLPWSINAALASQSFYFAGHLIKSFSLLEKNSYSWLILGLVLWGASTHSGFFYLNVAQADSPFWAVLGGIGGSYVLMWGAKFLCQHHVPLKAVKYYGQLSLIVLCVHLIDINMFTISRKIYEAMMLMTNRPVLSVSVEILYRLFLTILGIIIIPRLPYLRSFYLARKYPFSNWKHAAK